MAIGLVVFNPAESKRIIMNYLYTANIFKQQGLPVFTLEMVFKDREHDIPDAFHVRCDSIMFHKERMCRILETKIPKKYKKIAFIDADVLFTNKSWYSETSKLLDTHDVVQPFEFCNWLDLTYTKVLMTRPSVLFMKSPMLDWRYHPGFAWAFRRDWYKRVGFFDWSLGGSGDTLSCAGWLKKQLPSDFKALPPCQYAVFKDFFAHPAPRITCTKGELNHLYHGSKANRKYVERHELIHTPHDIRRIIKINRDGMFEWVNPQIWKPILLKYFKDRFDDDLSEYSSEFDGDRVLTS
jgi:hypothetical protein